jgi:hypothetical protein
MSSVTTNSGMVVTSSTDVVGVASTHRRLSAKALVSVAASRAPGFVAVPTATSPVVPVEGDGEPLTLEDGDTDTEVELEGENEELGEIEGLVLEDGL